MVFTYNVNRKMIFFVDFQLFHCFLSIFPSLGEVLTEINNIGSLLNSIYVKIASLIQFLPSWEQIKRPCFCCISRKHRTSFISLSGEKNFINLFKICHFSYVLRQHAFKKNNSGGGKNCQNQNI